MNKAQMVHVGSTSGQATRHLCGVVLFLAVLVLCWPTVKTVANLGLQDDRYVQIAAAPFLVAFLAYWERSRIFRDVAWNPRLGIASLVFVFAAYFAFLRSSSYRPDSLRLPCAVCAVILACMASFILCYGLRSFRAAWFPLCCLVLLIPVPAPIMDRFTVALEHASAATSYQMLRLVGIPVLAQGMKLALPGLEIEVAPECSGIHSCLALALVGLLASRVCLRSGWNRLALVVSTIPIAIFKNAIRISVLASLGAYVNRDVLLSPLHRKGGLVFTPLAVILLVVLLVLLQKREAWAAKRRGVTRDIPGVL
ncbi:MAG TPA: exosortase/archaeosortase family protein [Bryobacteraceae bacterium]|nr:exosortase/archaeosortase family protein [Bryobacteraceae bacterium]